MEIFYNHFQWLLNDNWLEKLDKIFSLFNIKYVCMYDTYVRVLFYILLCCHQTISFINKKLYWSSWWNDTFFCKIRIYRFKKKFPHKSHVIIKQKKKRKRQSDQWSMKFKKGKWFIHFSIFLQKKKVRFLHHFLLSMTSSLQIVEVCDVPHINTSSPGQSIHQSIKEMRRHVKEMLLFFCIKCK